MTFAHKRPLFLAMALLTLVAKPAAAQEKVALDLYTRVDYNWIDGTDRTNGEYSGFRGRYLFIRGNGDLGNGFRWSIAHRLNNVRTDSRLLQDTDWSYIDYTTPAGGWTFAAGKIVANMGTYEYEANPIDVPFFSHYVTHMEAYLFGVSAARHFTEKDGLAFMLTRSPYDTEEDNYLGYSLEWRGNHGCWHPIYTVNVYEMDNYNPMLCMSLGNHWEWSKGVLEADYTHRVIADRDYFSNDLFNKCDFTLTLRGQYKITDRTALICKTIWEYNNNTKPFDTTLPIATDSRIIGGGVEFYPTKSDDLRLFGLVIHAQGKIGGLPNEYNRVDLGIKWKVNLFKK